MLWRTSDKNHSSRNPIAPQQPTHTQALCLIVSGASYSHIDLRPSFRFCAKCDDRPNNRPTEYAFNGITWIETNSHQKFVRRHWCQAMFDHHSETESHFNDFHRYKITHEMTTYENRSHKRRGRKDRFADEELLSAWVNATETRTTEEEKERAEKRVENRRKKSEKAFG